MFPSDTPKARAEKAKCSSAVRQVLNDRFSWQKLKYVLAANFVPGDLVVTLTYDDEHLPGNIELARKALKKFFSQLQQHRRAREQSLRYVYCTETLHDGGRIHHHLVLNGTGADYDTIRSLWTQGSGIEISSVDVWGFEELAKYMTKEPREYGRNCVGERSWVGSRGLAKPEVLPTQWVNADVRLEPPVNAFILRRESFENQWCRYSYIEYMLPEPPKQKRTRPKR